MGSPDGMAPSTAPATKTTTAKWPWWRNVRSGSSARRSRSRRTTDTRTRTATRAASPARQSATKSRSGCHPAAWWAEWAASCTWPLDLWTVEVSQWAKRWRFPTTKANPTAPTTRATSSRVATPMRPWPWETQRRRRVAVWRRCTLEGIPGWGAEAFGSTSRKAFCRWAHHTSTQKRQPSQSRIMSYGDAIGPRSSELIFASRPATKGRTVVSLDDGELNNDKRVLLSQVPNDGTAIGNVRLRSLLGWPDDHYWAVRNMLVDDGTLMLGKGKGGSVALATTDDDASLSEPALSTSLTEVVRELDLYDPLRGAISRDWPKVRNIRPLAVEVTALQGRRSTGGRWSRPDLLMVEVRKYRNVPGKFLNVTTFEVKTADAIDVSAVYEALSHRRSATHAYTLFHLPPELRARISEDQLKDIEGVARSHGIGMIVAPDENDATEWEYLEDPIRHEPDPDLLDDFLDKQLSPEAKGRLVMDLR